MTKVAVTRVGTQVVVRISGPVGPHPPLDAALNQVESLVSKRVVVDLMEATAIDEVGVTFIRTLRRRWHVRLMNAPPGLLARCEIEPTDEPAVPGERTLQLPQSSPMSSTGAEWVSAPTET